MWIPPRTSKQALNQAESGASSPSYTTKATSQNSEEIETTLGPATQKDGGNSHWWQNFKIPWWGADEDVENEKEDVSNEIESELEVIESELQLTTGRTSSDKPLKHWWQSKAEEVFPGIPWWWADENVKNEKEDVADEIESELELIESKLQLTTRRTNSDKSVKLSSDSKVSSPKTPNDSEMVSDTLCCGG